jgi:hypothetical protein
MAEIIVVCTVKLLSGDKITVRFLVKPKMEVMEYYRDSSGFWRIKNFRRRRRARL